MLPGTMGHEFMQNHVFPAGITAINLEVLAHEQEVFIPMKYKPFRMSPIDTLVYDHDNKCLGVIDYKFVKDLNWVQQDAKEDNKEQVNLYAHVINAGWYMIIYTLKKNYDEFVIHRYEVNPEQAEHSIQILEKVDRWFHDKDYRKEVPWTSLASGLTMFTTGRRPYRYICEPSTKTPSYQGCPYKEYCLKLLSEEYGETFTSFIRYDAFLRSD